MYMRRATQEHYQTRRRHSTYVRTAIIKQQQQNQQEMWKYGEIGILYIVGRNVKWSSYYGNGIASPEKTKQKFILQLYIHVIFNAETRYI